MISSSSSSCISVVLVQAFCMGLVAGAWVTTQSTFATSCRTFAKGLVPPIAASAGSDRRLCLPLFMSETAEVEAMDSAEEEDDEEDDDEFEVVEYDDLTEADFLGSEWRVGTLWRRNKDNPKRVYETWVRLAVDEEGKNVCFWGDKAEGTWYFDASAQYLSISKTYLWGKQMWAGVIDDYYYLEGSVRGWNLMTPARVQGLWQAIRLGVDEEERGLAPWWDPDREEEDIDPRVAAAIEAAGPFMVDPADLPQPEPEPEPEVPEIPPVEEGSDTTTMTMAMPELEVAEEIAIPETPMEDVAATATIPETEEATQETATGIPPPDESADELVASAAIPETEEAVEEADAEIPPPDESAEEVVASATILAPEANVEDVATTATISETDEEEPVTEIPSSDELAEEIVAANEEATAEDESEDPVESEESSPEPTMTMADSEEEETEDDVETTSEPDEPPGRGVSELYGSP